VDAAVPMQLEHSSAPRMPAHVLSSAMWAMGDHLALPLHATV
jgi:hypothetical protein